MAITAIVQEVAGAGEGALRAAYDRSSDLGTAVGEVFTEAGHEPPEDAPPLRLADVRDGYAAVATARGNDAKREVMTRLLRRCDPLTARYVVAILGGELRIGLRAGHLESALAAAFERDLAEVRWAGMLTGDIGRTAVLARHDALASARLTLFHPLTSMLASPVADEAEALRRMRPPVWVEDKYDGIRAQLHKEGRQVRLYSRDLNDVTGQFPEVVRAAEPLPWDGILDGEILAWQDGAALPFLELQARLGRKAPSDSHPGAGAGHLRGLRCAGAGAGDRTARAREQRPSGRCPSRAWSSRCCSCPCASGAPAWRPWAWNARPASGWPLSWMPPTPLGWLASSTRRRLVATRASWSRIRSRPMRPVDAATPG